MEVSRQRVVACVGAMVTLMFVTAVLWLVLREDDQASQVLADGTLIQLRGVTYGKRHRMTDGSEWQRLAGRILPEKLARRWGFPFISHATTNDALVVWLEIDSRAMAGNPLYYASTRVAIGDPDGSEFFHTATTSSRSMSGGVLQGFVMPIVPPGRDKLTVTVQRYVQGLRGPHDATFQVQRPFSSARLLPGVALPLTSHVDNLQFVVKEVQSYRMPPAGASPASQASTQADCMILDNGAPTTNWMVQVVDVLDNAGSFHRVSADQDVSGRVKLRAGLSTNEVWRLRFFLARTGEFESNDLVTIRDVPLTVSDRAAFRPVTNAVNGVNLVLYDVAGFGLIKLSAFITSRDVPCHMVLVRGIDNEGRDLMVPTRPPSFALKAALDSRTADVTFAVTRMKSVEVFVKPTAPTNLASNFRPRSK